MVKYALSRPSHGLSVVRTTSRRTGVCNSSAMPRRPITYSSTNISTRVPISIGLADDCARAEPGPRPHALITSRTPHTCLQTRLFINLSIGSSRHRQVHCVFVGDPKRVQLGVLQ